MLWCRGRNQLNWVSMDSAGPERWKGKTQRVEGLRGKSHLVSPEYAACTHHRIFEMFPFLHLHTCLYRIYFFISGREKSTWVETSARTKTRTRKKPGNSMVGFTTNTWRKRGRGDFEGYGTNPVLNPVLYTFVKLFVPIFSPSLNKMNCQTMPTNLESNELVKVTESGQDTNTSSCFLGCC